MPYDGMTLLVLLFAGTGLLATGLSIPLIRRRVPPNDLYGLRSDATLDDPDVWYDANARSGRDLGLFGVLTAVCAVVLPLLLDMTPGSYGLAMTALTAGGATVLCAAGWRRAKRLRADASKRRDENKASFT